MLESPPAIPPNPSTAAMTARMKSVMAALSIVRVLKFGEQNCFEYQEVASCLCVVNNLVLTKLLNATGMPNSQENAFHSIRAIVSRRKTEFLSSVLREITNRQTGDGRLETNPVDFEPVPGRIEMTIYIGLKVAMIFQAMSGPDESDRSKAEICLIRKHLHKNLN